MRRLAVVIVAVVVLAGGTSSAQTAPSGTPKAEPQPVRLTELALRDGSRMYGVVVNETETQLVFRTQGGTVLTCARDEVLSVRPVTGVLSNGEFQPADPNVSRLFFGPTGRSLQRGQAYMALYEFALPFVQVGITDRISIGGGTPLIFFADDDLSHRPFWITPKVQVFRGDTTQVAVGAFHGMSGDGYGGVGYVVATHGTTASSFTIGAGSGYNSDGGSAAVVMFGGERQVRRNLKVISENYVWQGGYGAVSAGARFFGERFSTDLAIVVPVGADAFFITPLVNFVYIF